MSTQTFLLPDVGEGLTETEIVSWRVAPGDTVAVFGLAVMLTLLKAVLIFGAARLWGLNNRTAIETALVLGPAGEFAFVILGAGLVEGIASPAFTQTVLMAATISMVSAAPAGSPS